MSTIEEFQQALPPVVTLAELRQSLGSMTEDAHEPFPCSDLTHEPFLGIARKIDAGVLPTMDECITLLAELRHMREEVESIYLDTMTCRQCGAHMTDVESFEAAVEDGSLEDNIYYSELACWRAHHLLQHLPPPIDSNAVGDEELVQPS